jgi:hypothetical protein
MVRRVPSALCGATKTFNALWRQAKADHAEVQRLQAALHAVQAEAREACRTAADSATRLQHAERGFAKQVGRRRRRRRSLHSALRECERGAIRSTPCRSHVGTGRTASRGCHAGRTHSV